MVRGNTILTIDFITKQFRIENINGVFKKWFLPKTISFHEISEFRLKEKSVSSKHGRTTWLQLIAIDKSGKNIVFTDMSNKYPESYIAKKIKLLTDVIIWHEKQNTVSAA